MKTILALASLCTCFAAQVQWKIEDGGNGHRYELVGHYPSETNRWTWGAAKQMAEARGGHLVTITSQAENDFVLRTFFEPTRHPFWIGLSDSRKEGEWEWVSGEAVGFAGWGTGSPSDARPNNDCAIIGGALDSQPFWSAGEDNWDAPFVVEYANDGLAVSASHRNGRMDVRLSGVSVGVYRLLESPDLRTWKTVGEKHMSTDGPFILLPNIGALRFLRAEKIEYAPLRILSGPEAAEVAAGATVVFSVSAAGEISGYRWLKDGTPLSSATNRVLTIHSAQEYDAGVYTVRVTSKHEQIESDGARLRVIASLAPASLAGLTVKVNSLQNPYRWITATSGNRYVAFPDDTRDGSRGTYVYRKTGLDVGEIEISDYWDGRIFGSIVFTSKSSGTLSMGQFSGPFTIEKTLTGSNLSAEHIRGRTILAAIIDADEGFLSSIGGWRAEVNSAGNGYILRTFGFDGNGSGTITYTAVTGTLSRVAMTDAVTGRLDGEVTWFSDTYGLLELSGFGGTAWQDAVVKLE